MHAYPVKGALFLSLPAAGNALMRVVPRVKCPSRVGRGFFCPGFHEAEGFAPARGRCGFCTATSGPGATNLVPPLADATRDSRPVMALTGNTATTAEPEAFQAIDIVGITRGIATKVSLRAESPEAVQ